MKKTSNLSGLLGVIALAFTLGAFLFPLGTGLSLATVDGTVEAFPGYDFVFGNNAARIVASPAMIAFFVLLVVAVVFQLLGTGFGWYGGKFTGFLHLVSGLSLIVAAVLALLASVLIGAWVGGATASLGYGFLGAGISAAVSGLLSVFIGIRGFVKKAV